MSNKKPINRLLNYFSKYLESEKIIYLNTLNKVTVEKVELYHDFVITLSNLIYETYLGDDIINQDDIITKHFNWCWLHNINNYKKENIFFKETGTHYYYFHKYFTEMFYKNDKKNDKTLTEIVKFWDVIMNISTPKTKSDYDTFIELYKLQEKYTLN
jgi:hypothetical protein